MFQSQLRAKDEKNAALGKEAGAAGQGTGNSTLEVLGLPILSEGAELHELENALKFGVFEKYVMIIDMLRDMTISLLCCCHIPH
jgi:hypothetical protein